MSCDDERVKIPPAAWADIGALVGNLHVVKDEGQKSVAGPAVQSSVEEAENPEAPHAGGDSPRYVSC